MEGVKGRTSLPRPSSHSPKSPASAARFPHCAARSGWDTCVICVRAGLPGPSPHKQGVQSVFVLCSFVGHPAKVFKTYTNAPGEGCSPIPAPFLAPAPLCLQGALSVGRSCKVHLAARAIAVFPRPRLSVPPSPHPQSLQATHSHVFPPSHSSLTLWS